MRFLTTLAALAVAAGTLAAQPAPPPKTHLKVGDPAPELSLRTTAGTTFKLSEQRGKTVVLAFFPAAFTGG
jgi:peroxiredoxin Q/BCP